MYSTLKTTALVTILALSLTSTWVFAASGDAMPTTPAPASTPAVTPDANKFAMSEVKPVDAKTLKISFNKDLLEDTSMFEFLLTSKKDETKEIALTWITLSSSKELTANVVSDLAANEEYNMVVVFASDKEWKLIENGVDGMVTFKTPEAFGATPTAMPESQPVETPMDAAPVVEPTATPETPAVAQPVDEAAAWAKALPQTGPKEMMIIVLAMMLGLGIMYVRKRA